MLLPQTIGIVCMMTKSSQISFHTTNYTFSLQQALPSKLVLLIYIYVMYFERSGHQITHSTHTKYFII
jgi:hypothetical protein